MQQPQRYIPSVSDLYGTDEIELLLDEIRELELEPVCCQLDDEQDFEIAGSRAGELSHSHSHSLSLESPLGTCTSWDSHANYKQRGGHTPLPWGVALHCDPQHLKSPTGIVRILLVVGLFLLPLIGRLRLMVFCALFSLLITCLMLFLDISHIALMFPFNWTKVIIGYLCALEAFLLSGIASWPWTQYRQVPDDASELFIEDREMTPMSPINCSTDLQATPYHHNGNATSSDLYNQQQQSSYNQKPYIPAKRPNELNNQRPALGHTQTARSKPNQRYREGYHYHTSRQSPTFVLGDDQGAGPSTSRSNDNSSA